MPFNGAGTFTSLGAPTFPAVSGDFILASYFNATMNDVFLGLSGVLPRDGQAAMGANLPMGGFKVTGLGVATTTNDALAYGQAAAVLAGLTVNTTFAMTGTMTAVAGTLDLTGATAVNVPLQAVSDDSNKAASTAFVQDFFLTMPSGTLPSMTGKSLYNLRVNAGESGVEWGLITLPTVPAPVTASQVTVSTTLTATPTLLSVTPATPGIVITLPDATTMATEGGPVHIIDNKGNFAIQVKDNAGTSLGFVPAAVASHVGLVNNATAAGVWSLTGIVKTAVTANFVNTTITNQAALPPKVVALDADRTLFIFGGVDVYGVVYNAATFTWGAATLIRATVSSGAYLAIKTATDQAMVVSCNTTTGLEAVILSISGTTITVETATKVAVVLAGNWAAFGMLIAVDASWVVSYARATDVTAIRAITVTGVTPTIGAESQLTVLVVNTAAALYAAGSVVRCINTSTNVLFAIPYTVAGTTLTLGTAATTATTSVNRRSFQNADGNIIVEYTNTTHFAAVFKLTTTVEAVSAVSLGTSVTVPTNSDYFAFSATKTVFFSTSATTWYANILTDTAGTATAGTQITGTVGVSVASSPCGLFSSGNNVYFGAGTADAAKYTFSLDCSGTSPVLGDVTVLEGITNLPPTAPTDKYGVRSPFVLKAGTSAAVVSFTAGSAFESRYVIGAITQYPALSMSVVGSNSGVVGASDSESYYGAYYNQSGSGYVINKVEAAA